MVIQHWFCILQLTEELDGAQIGPATRYLARRLDPDGQLDKGEELNAATAELVRGEILSDVLTEFHQRVVHGQYPVTGT